LDLQWRWTVPVCQINLHYALNYNPVCIREQRESN
jgi:hypothetical protein